MRATLASLSFVAISLAPALALSFALLPGTAQAQDEEEGPSSGGLGDIDDILGEIDLGGSSGSYDSASLISYSGGLDQTAPAYVPGKPVTITHAGSAVTVYCQDREGISSRIRYDLRGTDGPALERMGKAISMRTWGSSTGGGVQSRIPAASSSVKEKDIELVVNLPKQAEVKVQATGAKVEVVGCEGVVTVAGGEDVFVSGTVPRLTVSSSRGDVKIELTPASEMVGASTVSATKGGVRMEIPSDWRGRMTLRGSEVSVWHTVQGTNNDGYVTGAVGTDGKASLTVTAGGEVDIKTP